MKLKYYALLCSFIFSLALDAQEKGVLRLSGVVAPTIHSIVSAKSSLPEQGLYSYELKTRSNFKNSGLQKIEVENIDQVNREIYMAQLEVNERAATYALTIKNKAFHSHNSAPIILKISAN